MTEPAWKLQQFDEIRFNPHLTTVIVGEIEVFEGLTGKSFMTVYDAEQPHSNCVLAPNQMVTFWRTEE